MLHLNTLVARVLPEQYPYPSHVVLRDIIDQRIILAKIDKDTPDIEQLSALLSIPYLAVISGNNTNHAVDWGKNEGFVGTFGKIELYSDGGRNICVTGCFFPRVTNKTISAREILATYVELDVPGGVFKNPTCPYVAVTTPSFMPKILQLFHRAVPRPGSPVPVISTTVEPTVASINFCNHIDLSVVQASFFTLASINNRRVLITTLNGFQQHDTRKTFDSIASLTNFADKLPKKVLLVEDVNSDVSTVLGSFSGFEVNYHVDGTVSLVGKFNLHPAFVGEHTGITLTAVKLDVLTDTDDVDSENVTDEVFLRIGLMTRKVVPELV